MCVHVRRWTHSIHAKNGWLFFFFSLSDVAAICSGNSSVSATMTVALLKSPFLFYGLRYRAYSLFFFFRFAFLICALSLFCLSGCDLRFFFFFLFSWSSAFSLCYIPPPPYFFPSIAAFLSSFAFLFVCCCFCFFFFFFVRTQPAMFHCSLLVFFFFFFSFSNSLLRTRK